MGAERLQKIIAQAGLASRRKAEQLIADGEVTVNGKVVREQGTKADPSKDHIKVRGKLIVRVENPRYILIYKPKKVVTTNRDPEGRDTVLDLIRGVRERMFPVGRLDYHSEGLLILTNDGDLANHMTHPSFESEKIYLVKVKGAPRESVIARLQRGITIEGKKTLPCKIELIKRKGRAPDDPNSWFEVRLREGRTRQIRTMFRYVGHPVSRLKRVAIGPISDVSLGPGDWRELTAREVALLKQSSNPRPSKKRRVRSGMRRSGARPDRS